MEQRHSIWFCLKCGCFFEPTDSIVRRACKDDYGYEYYHSSCIGIVSNITYAELNESLLSGRSYVKSVDKLTGKVKHKYNQPERKKCAYPPCEKLTVNKYCSRTCCNKDNGPIIGERSKGKAAGRSSTLFLKHLLDK